jgi:hypothetical protein
MDSNIDGVVHYPGYKGKSLHDMVLQAKNDAVDGSPSASY